MEKITQAPSRPRVLLIAGSDSSGMAGIQADTATCCGLEVHPVSVITAVTAQHSQSVLSINPVSENVLQDQLNAAGLDGKPATIKIGMVTNQKQALVIQESLARWRGWEKNPVVVWDPVISSSTGVRLRTDSNADQERQWMHALLKYTDILTPNMDEAEFLTGHFIQSSEDMLEAARALRKLGCKAVWLKGGHRQFTDYPGLQIDLFCAKDQHYWLIQPHLPVQHTRGTGCTLSSALAAFMARLSEGRAPEISTDDITKRILDAVVLASAYVHQGIRQGYSVGRGVGPVSRSGWPMRFSDYPRVVDDLLWLKVSGFPECGQRSLGLYPVVDSVEWLKRLMALGVSTIQLRIKDLTGEPLESAVRQAVALSQKYNCRLFINDYWRLAIKYAAYGVHLGQEDLVTADLAAIKDAGVRLGVSTHGEFEWARAASLQPSYLAIGAIYPTLTKEVVVVGENNLQRWVNILKPDFSLTAIGGINLGNVSKVVATGIDSVAVVSAITRAPDYALATNELQKALGQ